MDERAIPVIKARFRFLLLIIPLLILFSQCNKGDDPVDRETNPMEVIWELSYDSYNWGAYAPPSVLHDSLLIYSGDGSINCVTVDSGEWRWSSVFPSAGFMHKRFVYDDIQLYGFEGKDKVFSINIADGTEQWSAIIDSNREFSLNTDIDIGHYYIGTNSLNKKRMILKMEKESGNIIDSIQTEYMPWSLVINDQKLYCTFGWSPVGSAYSIGSITCYDPVTLDTIWIYNTNSGSLLSTKPIIDGNILFIGTVWGSNNKVFALNAETGEVVWETESYGCYQIELVGDTLYYDGGGGVHALDKNTGNEIWWTTLPNPDESGTLAYWDGYIYIVNFGSLYILDGETGEIVHKMRGPDEAYIYQVSAGAGKIFVQSSRHLYAFSPYDPEKDSD